MNMLAVVGTVQGSHLTPLLKVGEGVEAHKKGSFLRSEHGRSTVTKVIILEKALLKKTVRYGTFPEGMWNSFSVTRALFSNMIQKILSRPYSLLPAEKALEPISNPRTLNNKKAPQYLGISNFEPSNAVTRCRWWT